MLASLLRQRQQTSESESDSDSPPLAVVDEPVQIVHVHQLGSSAVLDEPVQQSEQSEIAMTAAPEPEEDADSDVDADSLCSEVDDVNGLWDVRACDPAHRIWLDPTASGIEGEAAYDCIVANRLVHFGART